MAAHGLGGGMIKAKNLTVAYDRRAVIHHLDFELPKSQTLAILGPNGSGKSTLLKSLAGVISHFEGQLTIGCDSAARGYLPQQHQIDRSLPITVEDLVSMSLISKSGAFRAFTQESLQRVSQILERLQLSQIRNLPVKSLSGGQMQRALWARLMVLDPQLILLDEPFNHLDESALRLVLQIILDWKKQGKTLVIVLHDSQLAEQIADQVLQLSPQAPILSPSPALCLADLTENP